jgi:MFS family permease
MAPPRGWDGASGAAPLGCCAGFAARWSSSSAGPPGPEWSACSVPVLALSSADAATVGAVAPQLERALHIGNAKVGLLSSVALLVGAAFVIPVGLLVDRIKRIPLLSISIILWSIASLASAFAGSYSSLLLSRLALGAVTATAGPAIASLTGDYFPARERGRIWSYILAGEAIGTAAGFMLSGAVASIISWRAAFVLLAIPGFFLARTLWRTVPEPQRGGQSRLEPGATSLTTATSTERARHEEPDEPERRPDELARAAAQRHGVHPNPRLVLTEDPQTLGLVRAIRYILSIPTNTLLIIGSSLGYFFFAGIQTFALCSSAATTTSTRPPPNWDSRCWSSAG